MAVAEVLDISYTHSPNPSLQFDAYFHSPQQGSAPAPGFLVFVHGGAWRSEDKRDHAQLSRRLSEQTGWPILVPNYRLTSTTPSTDIVFRHPGHAEDILNFLKFVTSEWTPPPQLQLPEQGFDPQFLILIGHSCSAHMLASIFLDSDSITPTLQPPAQLLKAVKGIAMSEGIYDLDLLLKTFPKYREWFIQDAFGDPCPEGDYAKFDVTRYQLRKIPVQGAPVTPSISWLVLHSSGDSLIDEAQSQKMYRHLVSLHETIGDRAIRYDFSTLKAEHDEILRGDESYIQLISSFVATIGH
ncbi:hypothetical protein NMY22_g17743 [Coprinellus aureogranulatus]|nr:hypothetical protein NMY22_g17743 [Coprinellus aureogranulatus]